MIETEEPFFVAPGNILPYFKFSATSNLEVGIISFFRGEFPLVIFGIFAIKEVLESNQTLREFVCFQLNYLIVVCLRHLGLQLIHKL